VDVDEKRNRNEFKFWYLKLNYQMIVIEL